MRSAQDLFAELNALDESNRIEAKRALQEIGLEPVVENFAGTLAE